MNPDWPAQNSSQESIKSQNRIEEALNWIRYDLLRPENCDVWRVLQVIEPTHSLIEIFDSVWWMNFRKVEPVRSQAQGSESYQ